MPIVTHSFDSPTNEHTSILFFKNRFSLWHFDLFLHFLFSREWVYTYPSSSSQFISQDDDIRDVYRLILILLTTVLRSSQKLLHIGICNFPHFINESEGVYMRSCCYLDKKPKPYFLLLLPFALNEDELDFLTFTTWLIFYCCRF